MTYVAQKLRAIKLFDLAQPDLLRLEERGRTDFDQA